MPQSLTLSSKHFELNSTWGQGTIMDYGPLQRFTGSMQYMAGRADLWSYNYTGVNGVGHVAPGSAGDWAVGVRSLKSNMIYVSQFVRPTFLLLVQKKSSKRKRPHGQSPLARTKRTDAPLRKISLL